MTNEEKDVIDPLIQLVRYRWACVRAQLRGQAPQIKPEPMDDPNDVENFIPDSEVIEMLAIEFQLIFNNPQRTELFESHFIFSHATQAQIKILLAIKTKPV